MTPVHPVEDEEWVAGRVQSWVETYKKAMLTPLILHLVAIHQPIAIAALNDHLGAITKWKITERGLYRTVKRLQDSGLLAVTNVDAPRTGAKRKELSLPPLGRQFLTEVGAHLVPLHDTSNQ